ncbi:MAG: DUF4381 domain-containing protein [Alphaproteobacteria bacterium]|nr:DUF4381 domain-containing protein [Alphaproteobacteria bacterium]
MSELPEIRDIFIPDDVSFFPLAYGWWVVLCIILGLLFAIRILRWSIRTSKKYYSLTKLKKIDILSPVEAAIQMSELLRRICNVKYKTASALYGDEWIKFLNEHSNKKLDKDAAKLLTYAPFMDKQKSTYDKKTAQDLKDFCQHWIGANL